MQLDIYGRLTYVPVVVSEEDQAKLLEFEARQWNLKCGIRTSQCQKLNSCVIWTIRKYFFTIKVNRICGLIYCTVTVSWHGVDSFIWIACGHLLAHPRGTSQTTINSVTKGNTRIKAGRHNMQAHEQSK